MDTTEAQELQEAVAQAAPLTEEEQVREIAGRVRSRPWAGIQTVECDLPEYQGVRVTFRTDNYYEMVRLFREEWGAGSTVDRALIMRWFVKGFEGWDYTDYKGNPEPCPTEDKPEAWLYMLYRHLPLVAWCINEGYEKAREQALSPNSVNGSKQHTAEPQKSETKSTSASKRLASATK